MGATRNCSKSHASTSTNSVMGLLSNQNKRMNIGRWPQQTLLKRQNNLQQLPRKKIWNDIGECASKFSSFLYQKLCDVYSCKIKSLNIGNVHLMQNYLTIHCY
jgi:hypothetical protein